MEGERAVNFGEKLRRLREIRGLKQEELGQALHTTQRKISYLENGQNEPSLYDLKMFCTFFHVSADYMLGLPYDLDHPR